MTSQHSSKVKVLGVFSLAMMTAVSVDSVRNLPATALFGSSLVFFFLIGALCFLLPSALVSAELASCQKQHAGIYTWVKEAFGPRWGFFAVWFQWIENVIWYPTILSFVAGTIGYLISPSLASNKLFLMIIILTAFWGVTLINLVGIKSSARFSNYCAVLGLIIPMLLIIILGATWLLSGRISQIHFSLANFLPHTHDIHLWTALTGIIMSFCGMEIATVHAADVKRPQSAYPRAMLIATLIIVLTLLSGALSIAIVLPAAKISLVSGIMQAFHAFFAAYHLNCILPIVAFMLIIGGMGGVNNWVIAPIRGLLESAKYSKLPKHMQKKNLCGAPSTLLIYQAIIVSLISTVFLEMPTINSSYWLLTALAAQLYMFMYILLFAAGIRLRYLNTPKQNGFKIPGGLVGIGITGSVGILGALATIVVGFIPPCNITVGNQLHYEIMLITGLISMSLPALILSKAKKTNK